MEPIPKRALRRVLLAALGLVLLVVGFLVVERVRGRSQLEEYIAQMRARGERFTVAEIRPPPAETNGAGGFMAAGFPTSTLLNSKTPRAFFYVSNGLAVPVARYQSWMVKGESQIVFTTNAGLFEVGTNQSALTNTATRRGARQKPDSWNRVTTEELAAELAIHSNMLAQVRSALELGHLDFDIPYERGFNVPMTHLSKQRTAGSWLRAACLSELQRTNLNAAMENLSALGALSHATATEALLISELVRIANHQTFVSAVWEALQVEGWTDRQLEQLQRALGPPDFVPAMVRAFEMERVLGVTTIDQAANDYAVAKTIVVVGNPWLPASDDDFPQSLDEVKSAFGAAIHRGVYFPLWRFAWKDHDKLHLLKLWQKAIDEGRAQAQRTNVTANGVGRPPSALVDRESYMENLSAYDRARFLVSSHLIGVSARTIQRAVSAEAAQLLAVTAVSVKRFQLENPRLPGSLSELTPKFLPAVPLDPFDGQPLRYVPNSNGTWLLYSVGTNGKDEGGNSIRGDRVAGKPNFTLGPDMVWPRAATPEEVEAFARQQSKIGGGKVK